MNHDFNLDDLLSDNQTAPLQTDEDLDQLLSELNSFGISSNGSDPAEDPSALPDTDVPQKSELPAASGKKSYPPLQPVPYVDEENATGFIGTVRRYRTTINLLLIIIAVFLCIGIAFLLQNQGNADPYNGRILDNVFIGSVNVGSMTKEQALKAVTDTLEPAYQTPMTVIMDGRATELKPTDVGIALSLDAAVDAAFSLGRESTAAERQRAYASSQEGSVSVCAENYIHLDVNALRKALQAAIPASNSVFSESSYTLEGTMPALGAESYDSTVPCQVLKLYKGTTGSDPDLDAICQTVTEAYGRCEFTVEISQSLLGQVPAELDLNAIYSEICVDPQECYTDTVNNQTYEGACGYAFDRDEAQRLLDNAQYGQTVEISMNYILPQKLSSKTYYPNILSSYTTEIQGTDEGYITNLRLVARTLDGMILQPWDNFSFDIAVPNRTAGNGYVSAPLHMGSCADIGTAGGCDQAATTLFGAALCADLQILEFHTLSHACAFTEIRGTEVRSSDLKFRNTQSFPIQLQAKVSGNKLIIRILCEEAVDWYIQLEAPEVSTIAPGSTLVRNTGRAEGDVIFEGLAGGIVNLTPVRYSAATGQVTSKDSPRYITIQAASKLIAAN